MKRAKVSTKLAQTGVLVLAGCLLAGCNTAKVTSEQNLAAAPTAKPEVIYVTDFDLGAQNIQHQDGLDAPAPGQGVPQEFLHPHPSGTAPRYSGGT